MEKKELKKRVTELKKEKQELTEKLAEAFSSGRSTDDIVKKLSNVQLELQPLERELGEAEEKETWEARWQEPENKAMWDDICTLEKAFEGAIVSCRVSKRFSKGAKCTLQFYFETKDGEKVYFTKAYLPQIKKVDGNGVQIIKTDARCLN